MLCLSIFRASAVGILLCDKFILHNILFCDIACIISLNPFMVILLSDKFKDINPVLFLITLAIYEAPSSPISLE